MGIREDIRDAYRQVGIRFSTERDGVTVSSGEYLLAESASQITKPFIKEFFLEGSLPFDSPGQVGDLLHFTTDGRCYLLMSKNPEVVENVVIEHTAMLYKANVSGELLRASGEASRDPQTMRAVTTWNPVRSTAYGLLVESLLGNNLGMEDFGQLNLKRNELYMPAVYGAQPMDRYSPASGEYLKIKTVKTRQFPGVDVIELEEDTRE